jgi:hypothetical protein
VKEILTPLFFARMARRFADSCEKAAQTEPLAGVPPVPETLNGAVANAYLDRIAKQMGWDAK